LHALFVFGRNNLDDPRQRVRPVAGIDPFRGVSEFEVAAAP
jgi:hypothetical protein